MPAKLSFEGRRELRWMELGDCLVTYMEAEVDYTDQLWDEWMEALGRPSLARLLLCSWGPTQPSHQQWRRATRLMRDRQMPVAVVTDARHNLALAKAASWLGTNVQSFRWHQLGDGCDFLGFDKANKVALKAKVVALRDRFGPVTTGETGQHSGNTRYVTSAHLSVSSESVMEVNTEIQAKLAEIQTRLRERERSADAPPRD
jgi:hypothetical protein